MKICGIICEYNPFHNGHKYQIDESIKAGATHIVAVMSGNFVQRGDVAIFNKHVRAQAALEGGADLVIELPAPYSIASAELFAKGAIHILNSLGNVNMLSFGTECGSINLIESAAQASEQLTNSDEFKKIIASGISYPSAMHTLIKTKYSKETASVFDSPNNVLAIEYVKALKNSKSEIEPVSIKRNAVAHDSQLLYDEFASASMLRKLILCGESIKKFIPKECYNIFFEEIAAGNYSSISNLEKVVYYKLLSMKKSDFDILPDCKNGLAQRIIIGAKSTSDFSDLLLHIKTKCFTLSRIRRIMMYALLGIQKSDFDILPPYGRILALNEKGREILADTKHKATIPFSVSLSKLSNTSLAAKHFSEIDALSSEIYSLSKLKFCGIDNEYTKKITRRHE